VGKKLAAVLLSAAVALISTGLDLIERASYKYGSILLGLGLACIVAAVYVPLPGIAQRRRRRR